MSVPRIIRNIMHKNISAVFYTQKERRTLYFYPTDPVTINPTISLKALQYSSDSITSKCWNCNFPNNQLELFCSQCKTLQEMPESFNYFDVLGVKLSYNVNHKEIHEKYRQLQKMLHPDKFGNKAERERQISESLSSLVNKAYSTLTHPLERGLYLLELHNVSIPEDTTNLNPEFLMEIMERNEEVESASNDKEKVVKLMEENKAILEELSKKVADAFDKSSATGNTEEIKQTLIKMKYYASIENRLKALKQSLGIVD